MREVEDVKHFTSLIGKTDGKERLMSALIAQLVRVGRS